MRSPGTDETISTDMTRPVRPSTPPLRPSIMKRRDSSIEPPDTPGFSSNSKSDVYNVISRSEHATVPPSPGTPVPFPEDFAVDSGLERTMPACKSTRKSNTRTGAGIQKASGRTRPTAFRFMDLPGGTSFVQVNEARANY